MNNELAKNESKIPTLKELLHAVDMIDPEKAFENDKFQATLNHEPPKKWVQEHPTVKGWLYVPIGIVETLLTKIFKAGYYFEIVSESQRFNGIVVVTKLNYWHPIAKEWRCTYGIGGEALQLKKGSAPSDIMNLNHGALTMGAGNAFATSKMSAAKQLGKLFGRDLNREISLPYSLDDTIKEAAMDAETERGIALINKCETLKQLKPLEKHASKTVELFNAYSKKFDELNLVDDAK